MRNTRAKLNAYGASCGTKWGVDDAIRHWTSQQTPQQWYMNGSAQLWRNEPFDAIGTPDVQETIGDSGNCPTSFAMIASTLRGTAITPPIVCNYVILQLRLLFFYCNLIQTPAVSPQRRRQATSANIPE